MRFRRSIPGLWSDGSRRQFAMLGDNGQRICIDPASKLVMVHTALDQTGEVWRLWAALAEQFG